MDFRYAPIQMIRDHLAAVEQGAVHSQEIVNLHDATGESQQPCLKVGYKKFSPVTGQLIPDEVREEIIPINELLAVRDKALQDAKEIDAFLKKEVFES